MKRLVLFAGYSPESRIDEYVLFYISKLQKIADVYYFAANDAPETELSKLAPYTKAHWARAHDKYDFGSWQKLIFQIGWQEIEKYDSLLLVNDSCYGPITDLGTMLTRMESSGLDFWGVTENYGHHRHIQSYFLSFNRRTIENEVFQNFFDSISVEKSKVDICLKYEIGLSALLAKNGFAYGSYIDRSTLNVPIGADVSRYQNTLIRNGSPIVKRKVFTEYLFAEEDLQETRSLLNGLNYPSKWLPTAAPSSPESDSVADLEIPARPEEQPKPEERPKSRLASAVGALQSLVKLTFRK